VDVGAAIISMACLTLFLRVWKPKTIWRTTALKGNQQEGVAAAGASMKVERHDRATVIRAWVPWIVLSVFVFLWGIPQMKALLNGADPKAKIEYAWNGYTKIDFPVPGLNDMVQKVPPVVAKASTEKAFTALTGCRPPVRGFCLRPWSRVSTCAIHCGSCCVNIGKRSCWSDFRY
jgi:lactate permease